MKTIYEFKTNKEGILSCIRIRDGKISKYYDEKAINILRKKDNIRFTKAKMSNQKLVFENSNIYLSIKDLEKFIDYEYPSLLENNMEMMKKAFFKYKRKEDKNLPVKKGAKGIAAAGIVALAIISASAGIGKNKNKDVEINSVSIETEADDEYNFDDLDISYDNVITTGAYENQELMDELNSEENLIEEAPIDTLNFDYNKAPDLEKADNAKNYQEIVDKYADKWGISPNIVMSMLTQESGGYESNLMQIQFSSWEDQVITQYNFTDGKYQSIVLTKNPAKYAGKNITCIEPSDLNNSITNISVGTCILKQCMDYMNGHIVAGIQCYNFGYNAMQTVLAETERKTGVSVDEILSDQTNVSFLDNTSVMGNYGDPNYFYNISIYTDQDDSTYYIINHNDETNTDSYNYLNINNNSKSL